MPRAKKVIPNELDNSTSAAEPLNPEAILAELEKIGVPFIYKVFPFVDHGDFSDCSLEIAELLNQQYMEGYEFYTTLQTNKIYWVFKQITKKE